MAQLVSSLPPVPAYQAAHLLLSAPGALRPAGFGRLGASLNHTTEFFGWAAHRGMDTNPAQPAQGVGRRKLHGGNRGVRKPGSTRQHIGLTGRRDGHEQLALSGGCWVAQVADSPGRLPPRNVEAPAALTQRRTRVTGTINEARHARVLTNAERLLAELAIALPALRGAA